MTTSQQSRLGVAPEEGIKAPVAAVSSGNLALFDTGMTIAGYVVLDHDRICAAAQTDSTENGIYVARGGKTWERATDMNESDDVMDGQLMSDANTSAVYNINLSAGSPWSVGVDTITFGLLLTPVGFFWGAITGTLSDQADLQAELDAKSNTGHAHFEADILDLQAYLLDAAGSIAMDGEIYARQDAGWIVVDTSLFAPAVHAHVEADIADLQPYLLDAAGSIANDNQLWARANGNWQAFSTSSGTTGEIIAWPDDELPQNFLWCDGVSHNAVTFADLFAVLGYKYGGSGANFNVPDLRGQFIRGTANGSGQDPDRVSRTDRGDGTTGDAVGTKQSYEIQAHRHSVSVRVDPDSDTEGGNGDPRPDSGPLLTSNTGGSETRPRNVGMNYIIRYTGGGSGITQPPSIEVQDSGVTLTTAVQLLNFINFNITEPLDDQIDITFGSSRTSGEYCPGYVPVFLTTTSWRIDGIDVTKSYRPGRRLRFIDGASNYYGTIVTSTFSGNTIITMSMDTGLLTATISEVCFTTSATAWSPISADPFAGNSINDVTSGQIGAVDYVFAVGNGGRAGWSDDGGLNWTMLTTGTSEHLNVCEYDSVNEQFWMGGDAGVIVKWDGTTVTLDTTSIPALSGTENDNINALTYSSVEDAVIILFLWGSGSWATASTDDNGATWSVWDTGETFAGSNKNATAHATGTSQTGPGFIIAKGNNTGVRVYTAHNDVTASNGASSTPNGQLRNYTFWNVTQQYIIADTTNRIIASGGQWTGIDGVNITEVVRDFAYSSFHDRLVLCGENGQLAFWDGAKKTQTDAWEQISSGFDPLVTINAVHWDPVEGGYIAVAANGQICRSSTGLGDPISDPAYSGWAAIAADPFAGGQINKIIAGAIGGTIYWVAAGPGGQLFYSSDVGVTWTQVTTGTTAEILTLVYDSSNQRFLAGCAGGDFLHSTTGTGWTLDNTTVAALGLTGSGDIHAGCWDAATGTWALTLQQTPTSPGHYEVDAALTTFTVRDVSSPMNTTVRANQVKSKADFRIFWGNIDDISYRDGAADTTDTTWFGETHGDWKVAVWEEAGTNGNTRDMAIGHMSGLIQQIDTGIVDAATAGANRCWAINKSSAANRWIAVFENGEIKTLDGNSFQTGTWFDVSNPFTAHIRDVWYDPTDDMFIAVAQDGTIARSVDGIS